MEHYDQSMSIMDKGPGQDAAFNSYPDSESVAAVKNIGKHPFIIRDLKNGESVDVGSNKPKEKKKVILKAGIGLYLDSGLATKAWAALKLEGS